MTDPSGLRATATDTSTPTATATATATGCGQNSIINGSFESPWAVGNVGPGRQQYLPGSQIGAWMVGGTGDVYLHKYPEMDAGPTFWFAQEGSFYLDLSGSGTHATVYQYFSTTPGATYKLFFHIGASIQTPPAPTIKFQVIGGALLLSESVTPLAPGPNINWTLKIFTFMADSSSTRLEFFDNIVERRERKFCR